MSETPSVSQSPWTQHGPVLATVGSTITLVDETTFCLSNRGGDILAAQPHGLFFLDTRFVSTLRLEVNGLSVEALGVDVPEAHYATFFGRASNPGDDRDGHLVVIRNRSIGRGLVERIQVKNHGPVRRSARIELAFDADFADVFEVKDRRTTASRVHEATAGDSTVRLVGYRHGSRRSAVLRSDPPASVELRGGGGLAWWDVDLDSQAVFETCVEITAEVAGREIESRRRCGQPDPPSQPSRRIERWREALPSVTTDDYRLERAVQRATADLAALTITDPDHPDDLVVAAGAPWFMTLFGRDALLTSMMTLIFDRDLALGTLRTLARLQGTEDRPDVDEQPGKILHEVRFNNNPSWRFAEGERYYGSVDATPLFVVVLGQLFRWGLASEQLDPLLAAADRALAWIERSCDSGDGYLRYARQSVDGLANQGWKDSWDGIRFADGRIADAPLALSEVQGYVYAAYMARAAIADSQGDLATSDRCRDRARQLRERFHRDFWLDDRGYIALALDQTGAPVDALTSNIGHCLWSGIVDAERAGSIAEHLMGDSMFTGWGVRTMSSANGGYDPVSYHCGSVWPHDNAIVAAGLARYGYLEEAQRIVDGLLDVSTHFGGRLPELLAGTDRASLGSPAIYPTSCIPQAWAAASPLLFVRSLLGFEPDAPNERLHVASDLPSRVSIDVRGIRVGTGRASVRAKSGPGLHASVDVTETAGLQVVDGAFPD